MHKNTVEDFWKKVNKTEGCWEWTGCLWDGYGKIQIGYARHKTHRLSFELANGPIPEGMKVCHKCDNRKCVRPDHLFLGTDKDNAYDAAIKDRTNGKLTHAQVFEILDLSNQGVSYREIARRFGVNHSTVIRIRSGDRRKASRQLYESSRNQRGAAC